MANIPIFLSSDNNYAPFVATTIASICDNTESFCRFYILDSGISIENQRKIISLNETFNNFSIEFIKFDIYSYLSDFEYINQASHVSISTYNRFFISNLKPKFENVLYLDVDLIATGDIQELFSQHIEKTVGWVTDESSNDIIENFKKDFGLNFYFNAGVMLINLKKWQENNYTSKALQFEKLNRSKINFADQDILNVILKEDSVKLNSKFNVQISGNGIIRHFVNVYKPWKVNYFKIGNQIKPLADFDTFWKYAQMTPFYEELKENYEKSINSSVLNKRMSIFVNKMKGKELIL